MSVILQPQVAFPIVRQIANHLDATTYYVRAVVRNSQGTTIDTVNLTFQDNQRYQASWRVPADPSGQGTYVSIVTSVYTDAGYTTKSSDYGDEENTYLIFDRVMPAMRGGGGGLDGRTVRRIIQEEIEKLPKPEKLVFPEIKEPEMRWNEVFTAIAEMRDALDRIPTEKPNFTPLTHQLNEIKDAIAAIPTPPETDITPILERLNDNKEYAEIDMEDVKSLVRTLEEKLVNAVPREIDKAIKNTRFVSQFNTFAAPNQSIEQKKDNLFDISKLTQ